MVESRLLHFGVFDIRLELRDDVPEGYREQALGGVDLEQDDKGRFRIWFKTIPTSDGVIHELWHLFFTVMKTVDPNVHYFEELNCEVYAYSFQHLYDLIIEALTGMRLYKKRYDQRKEENG